MGSSAYWARPRASRLATWLGTPWAATLRRHALVGTIGVLATLAFQALFADLPPERAWNRALADASLLLFAATMLGGAVLRLWDLRPLFDVRRELGVWAAVLATAHVAVVAGPLARFDAAALARDAGYAMGNLVGAVALLYTLLLAATSNDLAQRRLGSSWTHLQRGAVTCYVLVGLHTAYFLFLHPWVGAEAAYAPTWMRMPFLMGAALVLALRTAAFWKTAARVVKRTGE